jgi:hypothetical protein
LAQSLPATRSASAHLEDFSARRVSLFIDRMTIKTGGLCQAKTTRSLKSLGVAQSDHLAEQSSLAVDHLCFCLNASAAL